MDDNKKISLPSMIFFGICSLVVLYTWSRSAAVGTHGVGVWIVMFILFLLPNCFAVSELGSSYAEDGGISLWVTKAFGPFAGSLAGWFYWVNYVFGLPYVFVTVMGNLQGFFFPELTQNGQMIGVIALIWFTVIVGICNSGVTQKITAFGGYVVAGIALVIMVLAVIFGMKNGIQTDFSLSAFMPTGSSFVSFAPTVVFNLLGFELISSVASKCDNPEKNVPKFTMITGIIVGVVYIAATLSIMTIIPEAEIDSVNGLIDAAKVSAVAVGGPGFGKVIGALIVIAIIYALCASGIGWAFGTANVIASAGLGEKSAILGHTNKKFGTPDYAYLIMGIVGTIYTFFSYKGGSNVEAVANFIFSFSTILFMFPYVFMYPSVIALRKKDPDHVRPYKIPGGNVGLWLAGAVPAVIVVISMICLTIPEDGNMMTMVKTWLGFLAVVVVGVIIYINGERKNKK